MSNGKLEKLTFEKAVAIGELIRPVAFMKGEDVELLSPDAISKKLGIHLTSVKRWIAESVFVDYMPTPAFYTYEFKRYDAEPIEILAYYVHSRLSVTWEKSPEKEV